MMARFAKSVAILLSLGYLVGAASRGPPHGAEFDETKYDPADVIERDVAIIGGGASGTYAAVRLREMNQSIVLVEQESELGGHTKAYKMPETSRMIDYGVQGYNDWPIVHDFFARFDIPLVKVKFSAPRINFTNFNDGEMVVMSDVPPNFQRYQQELDKYPYLESGFDLPDPVPEDLLMPFGEFVKKHSLEDIVYPLYFLTQGMGDILRIPTIYVLKYADSGFLECLSNGILMTARYDNHEVYRRAQDELYEDVFVSSHVIATRRSSNADGVRVVIRTPTGVKLIKAAKLLITMPPESNNMSPFDLDNTEASLFKEFHYTGWYVALVANATLPEGISFQNTDPYTDYNLPILPDLYVVLETPVPGVHLVKFGSSTSLPDRVVKQNIRDTMVRLSMTAGNAETEPDVQILAYQAHAPFELHVSAYAIQKRFYHYLNALQGQKNTWYTGGTFIAFRTAAVWDFTEKLLHRMMDETSS